MMTLKRVTVVATAINLALCALSLVQHGGAAAQAGAPVLRGSALELVDERGQVRSRLNVEPGGTVVLRLLDQQGIIRVKLGADENGSGLVLLDEATEPAVHLVARQSGGAERAQTTSIKLKGAGGQARIIEP